LSADNFLVEIRNRKKRELEALDAELTEKQETLLEEKDEGIKDLRGRYERETKLRTERETTSIIEATHLQAKRLVFEAMNANFNLALDLIRQELKNYSKNSKYKGILEEMIKISKTRLGEDIQIWCREEDRGILKDIGMTASDNSIQILGGIMVENHDGTMQFDFTFDELLRIHEDDIYGVLVGKG
jgi:vacuolar-type H+-ATPase subunit E/Vma4